MTLLAFLAALVLLISVHEWGHYRVAVACGVKVLRFSIGFGRPLYTWRSSRSRPEQDTEFVLGFIPLGGYVKMLDESEGPVPPEHAHMAFNRKSVWARAAIVSAGPLANLLLAVVLYAATFCLGQYETRAVVSTPVLGSAAAAAGLRSGDQVLRVGLSLDDMRDVASMEDWRWWLTQQDASLGQMVLAVQSSGVHGAQLITLSRAHADEHPAQSSLRDWGISSAWSQPILGDVQPGGAAQRAGLQRGDVVLRIDQQRVDDAVMLRALVRASGLEHAPFPQTWQVQRPHHDEMALEVTPERVRENDGFVGRIGAQVGEAPAKVWVQSGLWDAVLRAVSRTWEMIRLTIDMMGRMLVGAASLDNLSGPLTMADYAGRAASQGLGAYLSYLALISVSLGVLNLMPLPLLDGGHLLYYLCEVCTGRAPSARWLDILQRGGLVILLALMAFSLFNDVVRLGWLP